MFRARHGASAAGEETVEPREPIWLDLAADAFAIDLQGGLFVDKNFLACRNALAGLFERTGHGLDLGATLSEGGFVRVGAFEAGQFFVFETVDLRLREGELMLQSFSLRRGGDVVPLGAQPLSALAMLSDVALQARAQCLFAGESVRSGGRFGLCASQGGFSLSNFGGKGAGGGCQPGAFQFDGLKFYQLLNQRIHSELKSNTRECWALCAAPEEAVSPDIS